MYIIRVLKRKDASSVVVAVVLGLMLDGLLAFWGSFLGGLLVGGAEQRVNIQWRNSFWLPFVQLILEIIILEIIVRVYVAINGSVSKQ